MEDFEKLGLFYLGRRYDPQRKEPQEELLLYDSKDLVTHAVCVGMTGSGKTGLCISLLEEAAIDGIPALIVDPKGDLSNLLLTFPDLKGDDFAPWINDQDAQKASLAPRDFAAQQAELWKRGLADWGQDGARIRRLQEAADFAIYTPGSNAGLPISIFRSLAAPNASLIADDELLREQIQTTAASLLALVGIDADPLQSREHILLSTILNAAWRNRQDLDLAALIQQIQAPSVTKIGVVDLESFYPAKERFALAMRFNNLLAAPGFEAWTVGEPLDIDRLLHTPQGKPRMSIFSIAHLNDQERMFFVSLLLNQTLIWMRTQSGTSSLRALLYMDEIYGYFPPVANPPSKTPLLTLLKQARAFGLGVVLATQNPVDLDYKGLANAGTWFIGRLQTERDKARVLDGLEGAAAGSGMKFDRRQLEEIVSGLTNRVFLMNNVHADGPVVFQVRWALSYLRGPMTREQIKGLIDPRRAAVAPNVAPPAATLPAQTEAPVAAQIVAPATAARPVLPPDVPQYFAPPNATTLSGGSPLYQPMVVGCAQVRFTDAKLDVDVVEEFAYLATIGAGAQNLDWQAARLADLAKANLQAAPMPGSRFAEVPQAAALPKNYAVWRKSFAAWLAQNQSLELFKSPSLKATSQPGESERNFRIRLQQLAREERDQNINTLRQVSGAKLARLDERIRRAQQTASREAAQSREQKAHTAIAFVSAVLSAVLGRKAMSTSTVGKSATAMRSLNKSVKESQDMARAQENVETLTEERAALEAELRDTIERLTSTPDPASEIFDTIAIKPKKTNISVGLVALVWIPS